MNNRGSVTVGMIGAMFIVASSFSSCLGGLKKFTPIDQSPQYLALNQKNDTPFTEVECVFWFDQGLGDFVSGCANGMVKFNSIIAANGCETATSSPNVHELVVSISGCDTPIPVSSDGRDLYDMCYQPNGNAGQDSFIGYCLPPENGGTTFQDVSFSGARTVIASAAMTTTMPASVKISDGIKVATLQLANSLPLGFVGFDLMAEFGNVEFVGMDNTTCCNAIATAAGQSISCPQSSSVIAWKTSNFPANCTETAQLWLPQFTTERNNFYLEANCSGAGWAANANFRDVYRFCYQGVTVGTDTITAGDGSPSGICVASSGGSNVSCRSYDTTVQVTTN
ncbi:MAG: hypothetical protein AAB691_03725 [Patescibacteria group bacterium]